jgi:hypothetical protein
MKQTPNGISDKPINDVGNEATHQHHNVTLEQGEDGSIRARITDQLNIDRMLKAGRITTTEHRAAEFLLEVFVNAGAFVKSLNPADTTGGSKYKKPPSMMTSGLMRLRDVAQSLEQGVDEDDAVTICMIIAKDLDVNDGFIDTFKKGLQHIDETHLR